MEEGKKIYFASDVHLGAPTIRNHRQHEQRFVKWLDGIKHDAHSIYLMGDIFDFWFEYKSVVPRGFTRFLGKLSEITDSGIPIHFFTGNHDVWVFNYLPIECGVTVHHQPQIITIDSKRFYLGHGDGLGNYDPKYNLLKKLFTNKTAQWCFSHLHPNIGTFIATKWSGQSRKSNVEKHGNNFYGAEQEYSIRYAYDLLQTEQIDYFIMGHRHIAIDYPLNEHSRLIHLGDWIQLFSYATFDGKDVKLCYYNKES